MFSLNNIIFIGYNSLMVKRSDLLILTGMTLLLLLQPVSAEMYQWKDKNGNIVISDSPPSGVKTEEIKPKNDQMFQVPPQEPSDHARPSGGDRDKKPASERQVSDVRVIVYMTDWCSYCNKAREYLRSIGANFIEHNIETDKSKKTEMLKKSGGSRGIPLIDVEGIIVRGFSPGAIQSAIDSRRKG